MNFKKKRFCFTLVLAAAVLASLGAAPKSQSGPGVIINSGHNHNISFLGTRPGDPFLYSAADDGTFKIWNAANGNLNADLHLAYTGFRLAALNPVRPEVAVITSDSLNSYVLTLWDWEKNEKIFAVKLPELPLFLQYSPNGSYLVYGIANWDSLTFIDASSGRTLPYLTEGFGIVSSVFISASEKTILTYGPSGSLQYWNVEEGTQRTRLSTQSNLNHPVFTPNGRYMAAADERYLYYIDLLSGAVVDRRAVSDILALVMTDSGELVSYSRRSGGFLLSRFSLRNNTLALETEYPNFPLRSMGKMASRGNLLYLSNSEGTIYSFDLENETSSVFVQSQLKNIQDIGANGNSLVLAGEGVLSVLPQDFFLTLETANKPELRTTVFPLPFQGLPAVSPYGLNDFLIWTSEAAAGSLAVFSPSRGVQQAYTDYAYAFADLAVMENKVVTLDRNGECRVLNLADGSQEFQFTSFGLQTVTFTTEGNLLAGRSKSVDFSTPLLHINTKTGETVPVEDENLRISRLVLDPFTGAIYSLGIEERHGKTRTILKVHSGQDFFSRNVLLTYLGEALTSPLYVQEDGTRVFISLGAMGIKMHYWGGFTDFETGPSASSKLIAMDRYLLSLNSDNSISFWQKSSGELAFTFYLFRDDNWAAVFPGGNYASSPGASRYIRKL